MKLAVTFREGNIMTPCRQDVDAKASFAAEKKFLGNLFLFFLDVGCKFFGGHDLHGKKPLH